MAKTMELSGKELVKTAVDSTPIFWIPLPIKFSNAEGLRLTTKKAGDIVLTILNPTIELCLIPKYKLCTPWASPASLPAIAAIPFRPFGRFADCFRCTRHTGQDGHWAWVRQVTP